MKMLIEEFRASMKWLIFIRYNDQIGNPFFPFCIQLIAFWMVTNSWMFNINLNIKRKYFHINSVKYTIIWLHVTKFFNQSYLGKWHKIKTTTIHIKSLAILSSIFRLVLFNRTEWFDVVRFARCFCLVFFCTSSSSFNGLTISISVLQLDLNDAIMCL